MHGSFRRSRIRSLWEGALPVPILRPLPAGRSMMPGRRASASGRQMEVHLSDAPTTRDWCPLQAMVAPRPVLVVSTGAGPFEQALLDGRHVLTADEPAEVGGGDTGPGSYELLLKALGGRTSRTLRRV